MLTKRPSREENAGGLRRTKIFSPKQLRLFGPPYRRRRLRDFPAAPEGLKYCSVCLVALPLAAFWNKRTSSDGTGSTCKPCALKQHAEWRRANRELRVAYSRRQQLKRYSLRPEDYDAMLVAQDGRCAICRSADPGRGDKHFSVDHAHEDQHVRGLLCHQCNRGLGTFRDDPDSLRAAAAYLESFRRLVVVS